MVDARRARAGPKVREVRSAEKSLVGAPAGATVAATEVSRLGPWLVVRFPFAHVVASWAIVGGGLVEAAAVAWRQVDESELRPPVDAAQWLRARMREEGLDGAVGLLTGCDLDAWVEARSEAVGAEAHCIATVGLDNALRAGDPA
jgi:Adenosylcobinamide amidohydrolase